MIIPFHTHNSEIVLALPTANGMHYLQPHQIIRVQAMSNYCKIFFINGRSLVVAKVLAWFEEKLGNNFWRIHRSHLINRQHIFSINIKQYTKIILSTGEELPVSKRRKQAVKVLMAG